MAYVKQRHKTDCGVACLAMLCDAEYEDANRAIPWRREGCLNGTTTKQLIEGAAKLGYETRGDRLRVVKAPPGAKSGDPVTPDIWRGLANNSLAKIPKPLTRDWHWVVWRKGKIYDPSRGVFTPEAFYKIFGLNSFPTSSLQFVPEGTEDCPECGTATEAKWSGIECPNCGWTFCL